jgi:TonB family protein
MNSNELVFTEVAASLAVAVPVETARPRAREVAADSRFAPVVTLVLWVSCSLIGMLGFAMPYARPLVTKAQPEALQVEMLNVELTSESLPELPPSSANALATPPPADAVVQPQLPQPLTVALPSASIAFAVPVEGPARIVDAAQASYSTSAVSNNAVAAATQSVQSLTFGQGAGKQPAPEYPWRAQNEGQEGVVNVRFTVAANGRVVSAEAVNPSPWPMLNDSAVRAVRNRWRFTPGTPRAYEVAIRFVLPKERS